MTDFFDTQESNASAASGSAPAQQVSFTPLDHKALAEITLEVVGRLAQLRAVEAARVERPRDEQIDRFCDVLVGADERHAERFVEDLHARGVNFNTIYLGYVAGAAIRLGERWENDTSTIFEMTVASGRMYSIMRRMRRAIAPPLMDGSRRAIFASVPGECHTLGVTMAADLFRKRGWDIDMALGMAHDELVESIGGSTHSFIGLSASRPDMVVELTRLIVDLRIRKPHAFIMVSGKVTDLAPGLNSVVDADIVVHDAPSAIVELEKIRKVWDTGA